jgi:5-methylcytosine-specific restriction endonuclease McrA
MANDYKKIEQDDILFQKFLKNFVIATLRRATYRWPYKNMAKNLKRLERGLYECQVCHGAFSPKQINLDHIIPVIDPFKGFTDWNDFINRLFVKTDGFQVLCSELCHSNKSILENIIRTQNGQKPIRIKTKSLIKKKRKSKI